MKLLRNRWFILCAFIVPLNIVYGFDRGALALVAVPVRNELRIDYVLMSQIIVISTVVYACMQMPAGWLASRFGVRRVMAWACILWSCATFLTAVQTEVIGFFASRILLGITQAPDWVTCILAIKILFPEAEREKANSIMLAALYIGFVICGTVTPWIAEFHGWRYCFSLYGWIGIAFGVVILFFYRGADHDQTTPTDEKIGARIKRHSVIRQVSQGTIYYVALLVIFGFFSTTFPHFANSAYGVSPKIAGRYFSILWTVMYLSVLAWGFLIKIMGRRKGGNFIGGAPGRASGLLLAAVLTAIGVRIENPAIGIFVLSAAMIFVGLCQVLIWTFVQQIAGSTGVAAGVVMFAGNLSVAVSPVLAEVLFRTFGSWAPLSIVSLIAGLVGACVWIETSQKGIVSSPDGDLESEST